MHTAADIMISGKLLQAMHFAAHKHRDQRRKDPRGTPYINHPLDVAHILWFEGEVHDIDVLTAAILHDTVEDTDTTMDEIELAFGHAVARYVEEVTDDTSLSRHERKAAQLAKAAEISHGAKLIKLGDKISNLRDIARSTPVGWTPGRCRNYFEWAAGVVNQMRGTNAGLERVVDRVYHQFLDHFAEDLAKDPVGR